MKKKLILAIIVIAVIGALIFAYIEMSKERAAEAAREKPVAAASRVQRNASGEVTLVLDAETQKRVALKVEPAVETKLSPEAKGFGRVLDPAPLAALANELAAAQAAATASQKEFERLQQLRAQDNASDRALQSAQAATQRARAAAQTAQDRLSLTWGKAVAAQPDLLAFISALTALESALVRVDLPAGQALKSLPMGARIALPSSESELVEADFLGAAPSVDPQTQGQGFFFLVRANQQRLLPNAAVTAFLKLAGEPLNGALVPRAAVVRAAGRAWVYVQGGDGAFARREVALGHPTDAGWFVTAGVSAGERVVVVGAQTLLSEELKYQIKMLE